jgi:serine/threonine protein kinase
MQFGFFALFSIALGEVIRSPTRVYKVCKKLVAGENGKLYRVISYGLTEAEKDCATTEPKLILKCTGTGEESDIMNEVEMMGRLAGASWIPEVYEWFVLSLKNYCYSMEELGMDLHKLRDMYPLGQQWPWATLGSIGARSIEIVKQMHTEFGVINTDLHLGNWMLEKTPDNRLTPQLKMIDFGYGRTTSYKTAPAKLLEEIRQQVIALRFLWNGDFKFYVWKRYKTFNKAEICAGVPEIYCRALLYVRDLKLGDRIDYDLLIRMMRQIVEEHGGVYTGEIDWAPLLSSRTDAVTQPVGSVPFPPAQQPTLMSVPSRAGVLPPAPPVPSVDPSVGKKSGPSTVASGSLKSVGATPLAPIPQPGGFKIGKKVPMGQEIHSSTTIFTVCSTVVIGENGAIFRVVARGIKDAPKSCSAASEQMILKCTGLGADSDIVNEHQIMTRLAGVTWIPKFGDLFQIDHKVYCYAMEELGRDLGAIRKAYNRGQIWSWVTVGSIGAKTLELAKIMHTEFGIINRDLHPANWLLEKTADNSLSSQVKMIDFGYGRDRTYHKYAEKLLNEIRQIVIAPRYFVDGDKTFRTWKHYKKFVQAEICAGMPESYCRALLYVRDLKIGDPIDYDMLIGVMTRLVEENGGVYTGQIEWEPVLAAHGRL